MTTLNKIEALKVAFEAVTPGDWEYDDDGYIYGGNDQDGSYIISDPHDSPIPEEDERESNAVFITQAHQMMPALLRLIEAVEAAVREDVILPSKELDAIIKEMNWLKMGYLEVRSEDSPAPSI